MERKKGEKNKFAFDTFENSGNRSEWPSLSRENPVLLRKGKRMEGGKEREREKRRMKEGENGCKITNDLLATWTGV